MPQPTVTTPLLSMNHPSNTFLECCEGEAIKNMDNTDCNMLMFVIIQRCQHHHQLTIRHMYLPCEYFCCLFFFYVRDDTLLSHVLRNHVVYTLTTTTTTTTTVMNPVSVNTDIDTTPPTLFPNYLATTTTSSTIIVNASK